MWRFYQIWDGIMARSKPETMNSGNGTRSAQTEEGRSVPSPAEKPPLSNIQTLKWRDAQRRIESSSNVQETVRDIINQQIHGYIQHPASDRNQDFQKGMDTVKRRRRELHDMLENLNQELEGKTPQEVAAYLSSFLNIASQLSLQKIERIISVNCKLGSFFYERDKQGSMPLEMRQDLNLIFTVEEIEAIRERLQSASEDDPFVPFFASVLDQAFDVAQYNEMTGVILVEFTKHYLEKLESHGYDRDTVYLTFLERHERTVNAIVRAIQDLRELTMAINNHFKEHPVLEEFPEALRLLIQIRLGILPQSMVPHLIEVIREKQSIYSRARNAIAGDINRLPFFHHAVRIRQYAVLNLHRDVLKFTAEKFEAEFKHILQEFEKLCAEIEIATISLNPSSPEYAELLHRKEMLHKKIAEQRKQLDIIQSQLRLVEVHRQQVQCCIVRFREQYPEIDKPPEFQKPLKPIPASTPSSMQHPERSEKSKITRMVTASLRENKE